MPVYVCWRGECANAVIHEGAVCFVLKDAQGRDRLCAKTDMQEIPDAYHRSSGT
jgi:hypothetical protein